MSTAGMPRSRSCSIRAKRERRLARAGAAEHRGVPLQDVLVQRDQRAPGQLAAGDDARAAGVLVEDDGERQLPLRHRRPAPRRIASVRSCDAEREVRANLGLLPVGTHLLLRPPPTTAGRAKQIEP